MDLGKVSPQSERKTSFAVLLKLGVNHFVSGSEIVETLKNQLMRAELMSYQDGEQNCYN